MMMKLCDYIEEAAHEAGSITQLAHKLGITQPNLSKAKAHARGLPNDVCVRLAELIGAEPLDVIAASELATEKKEDKRIFWKMLMSHGAGATACLLLVSSIMTAAPTLPYNRTAQGEAGNRVIYIMSNFTTQEQTPQKLSIRTAIRTRYAQRIPFHVPVSEILPHATMPRVFSRVCQRVALQPQQLRTVTKGDQFAPFFCYAPVKRSSQPEGWPGFRRNSRKN